MEKTSHSNLWLIILVGIALLVYVHFNKNEPVPEPVPPTPTPQPDNPPAPKPEPKPEDKLTDTQKAMIEAGKVYPGVEVCKSELQPLLMELCTKHAEFMAKRCYQDHANFQARWNQIHDELGLSATEIVAESWERQANDPLDEVAKEMYNSWRQSPGHWRVASQQSKIYGADMKQGKNGVWYACIIVANDKALHSAGAVPGKIVAQKPPVMP